MKKKLSLLLILAVLMALLTACSDVDLANALNEAEEYLAAQDEAQAEELQDTEESDGADAQITEDGQYSDPVCVALYIHTFGHLPDNFLTKSQAESLGWVNSKGNLWDVAPGCSIGGDKFGNREGLLPKAEGRQYYECDVNYEGGYRGGERIVFSNDGLVFYSQDHYSNFTQLY